MSNVGSRKRKSDAPVAAGKKARKGGSLSMLRPRILRPVDVPKLGDKMYQVTRLVHLNDAGFGATLACTDGGGYQMGYQLTFSLNQIPNYLAWTACFREYRITKCEVEFHPRWNTTVASGTAGNHLILGYVETDAPLNFAGVPYTSTENPWLNMPGYRQQEFSDGRVIKASVSPSPFMAIETTPTNFNAGIGAPSTWLLTSQPTTPHQGLAFRIYSPQATSNDGFACGEVYVKYTVQFRSAI